MITFKRQTDYQIKSHDEIENEILDLMDKFDPYEKIKTVFQILDGIEREFDALFKRAKSDSVSAKYFYAMEKVGEAFKPLKQAYEGED